MTTDQLVSLGWQLAGWLASILASALTVFTVRYLRSREKYFANNSRLNVVWQAVRIGVTAAEQTIAKNPDKKAAAMAFAQSFLDARGIKISLSELDASIESAVQTETKHADPPAHGEIPPSDPAPVIPPADTLAPKA